MRRLTCALILTPLVATVGTAWPVAGQFEGVWLEPRVGWSVPTESLGRTDVLLNAGFGVFDHTDEGVVIGLGVGADLGAGWATRASVENLISAGVQGEWRCAPFVACPSVLLSLDGELSRWSVALDAMYRPTAALPVTPVLSIGFGIQHVTLGWGEPSADITLPAFSFDETGPTYRLGAGLERRVGDATLFGSVEAQSSRFGGGAYQSIEGSLPSERKRLLDLGFIAGMRVRLH